MADRARAQSSNDLMVVDGERFTVRQVTDSKFSGQVDFYFGAPKEWKDESRTYWNLQDFKNTATFAITIENPANSEKFFWYRKLACNWLPGPNAQAREGQEGVDGVVMRPMQPVQALEYLIKQYRSKYPDLKFIGSQDLPGLIKAYGIKSGNQQHGIGEKVSYSLDGKPVEEEFYAVHYYSQVNGESIWGLAAIHSFRAPPGTLDKRRNVFAAIAKSIRPTRAFAERRDSIHQQQVGAYKAHEKATYDSIARGKELAAEGKASEDRFDANLDAGLAQNAAARANASGATARSGNDKEDDYIRDVETVNDPNTGTTQRSILQENHWTDGYGNYRDSNDPNYDPNKGEVGQWTQMTPAR